MFRGAQPLPQSRSLPAQGTGAGAVLGRTLGLLLPASPVVEFSGDESSGKSTLALQLCLNVLREGRGAAWIDSGQGFYPLAAIEAGEPLDRLLVVRVREGEAVLRAADMVLSCSGAAEVLVATLPAMFRPPEASLLRLQRLAERSGSMLILLDERPRNALSLGAAVSLRLQVSRAPGGTLQVEVVRHKSGPSGQRKEVVQHGPDRLRVCGSL